MQRIAKVYIALLVVLNLIVVAGLIVIWPIWEPRYLMVLTKIILIVIIVNGFIYIYNEFRELKYSATPSRHGGDNDTRTAEYNPRIKMRKSHGSKQ